MKHRTSERLPHHPAFSYSAAPGGAAAPIVCAALLLALAVLAYRVASVW